MTIIIIVIYNTGNDKIHQMTSQEPHVIRVDLSDFNNTKVSAGYSFFGICDHLDDYRASIGVYSGTAGTTRYGTLL